MDERSIITGAAEFGGHISRAQLIELGMSDSAIQRRIATGLLEPVARRVYRVLPPNGPMDVVRGAVLALPRAIVSHHTAAGLHGVGKVGPYPLTVMVHTRTTHAFPGVRVRRCHDLMPHHSALVSGLTVTTLERTIVDLAAVLPERRLASALDDVLAVGKTTVERLTETLGDVARKGKPGMRVLRELLDERGVGIDGRMSRLEREGLELVRKIDGVAPELEYPMPWDQKKRFDLAFPEHKVAIEWDSVAWHSTPDRFEADRRRDRAAVRHGWVVLRYTWADVHDDGDRVVEETETVLVARQPTTLERPA